MRGRVRNARGSGAAAVVSIVAVLVAMPVAAGAVFQGLHGFDRFACHGVGVLPGDTLDDVAGKCGEPAWRNRLKEEAPEGGFVCRTEEWVYDFGHSQLLQYLRFRDGRLVTTRTGTYGFGGARGADCGFGANLSLGDTKLEVVARCGDPTSGEKNGERIGTPEEGEQRRQKLLGVDEWIYDFGPDRFVHYLTFRHGRLMEIRSGGFGR